MHTYRDVRPRGTLECTPGLLSRHQAAAPCAAIQMAPPASSWHRQNRSAAGCALGSCHFSSGPASLVRCAGPADAAITTECRAASPDYVWRFATGWQQEGAGLVLMDDRALAHATAAASVSVKQPKVRRSMSDATTRMVSVLVCAGVAQKNWDYPVGSHTSASCKAVAGASAYLWRHSLCHAAHTDAAS